MFWEYFLYVSILPQSTRVVYVYYTSCIDLDVNTEWKHNIELLKKMHLKEDV